MANTTQMQAPTGRGGTIQGTPSGQNYTIDGQGFITVDPQDVLPLLTAGFMVVGTRSNLTATTDPAATNDATQDYAKGSRWVNTSSKREWVCVDPTATAAVWILVGQFADAQYATAAGQSALLTGAQVAGARSCVYDNTGTTPGNLQMPTAANLVAAIPGAYVGQSYILEIRNSSGSANTATITTNTGITLTGTMTIAQNVTRRFVVTLVSLTAVTVQSVGLSAAGA